MAATLEFDTFNRSGMPDEEASKPTLLIVDDEEGPRQSLRVVFKDDYKLLLAADGKTALDMARTQTIDVAILDIRMASMTGIELLEQLKQVGPDIEVIMLTAFETNDTIRQALRLRACDYLNKPFDVKTMRHAVAKALERHRLALEVRTNTQKLQLLQSELQQQKLEIEVAKMRGEIYASIIHDINGPLTIISGLIQIINQRISEETQVQGEDLEIVKDRMKRVTRQVTSCIEISRRYLGFLRKHPEDPVRVWVNQILVDLGELLRVHPSARHNQLLIHPVPDDAMVQINGTDLIQILLNLTLNALQCTQQSHRVEIRVQLLDQPLDLSLFHDGEEDVFINRNLANDPPILAISVDDDGPGIPADVLPKIFEPYFTTQKRQRGTGLGLCIVYRLLEGHGALHVHTKVGKGSIFTLYLPARTVSAEPAFRLPPPL